MLIVIILVLECHYADCYDAEYYNPNLHLDMYDDTDCRYSECSLINIVMLSTIMLSLVVPCVSFY
jgi:hypothetical protein